MILGVGVELVDVPRFEALLARRGERFTRRIFTRAERAYAARKVRGAESLAVRFAAKVATRRALGLPLGGFQEVEVLRERGRAPRIALRGASKETARALGAAHSVLTLTHDATWCIGQVIFESGDAP